MTSVEWLPPANKGNCSRPFLPSFSASALVMGWKGECRGNKSSAHASNLWMLMVFPSRKFFGAASVVVLRRLVVSKKPKEPFQTIGIIL